MEVMVVAPLNPSSQDLAVSSFSVLIDLMGEIHAGRLVGHMASMGKLQTNHPDYVVRIGMGAIMIALYKFEDLWDQQIKQLLADRLQDRWSAFRNELNAKKIREFRSLFVAHYSDKKGSPKPPLAKLEELIKAQGFETDEELFKWTSGVIEILQEIRDSLKAKYSIDNASTIG